MDHTRKTVSAAGDRPVGAPVVDWTARARPRREAIEGRFARLEPFDLERHASDLYAAYAEDRAGRVWDYLFNGPFADEAAYRAGAAASMTGEDPMFFTIIDKHTGKAGGVASLMRIDPAHGVIEVGGIAYAPRLQRTVAATEAMYLLARLVFDTLGYRRYEWKCNDLNAPSKRAARRLGFRYEGLFRNHMVVKGRNRDTAWYSITAAEWPVLRRGFERWLDPANFDANGKQIKRLAELNGGAVEGKDT